ncbi:sigma-54-dependent transcriptional regulator [Pseudoxanthomonas winnipegensis]|uniref:Sigma-54-dependent Fis family transcriptional regulator n=1 Tax=Pseudoxanthomonas winnipegensis TaxID=2480810 RepID=A0A4Q8L3Y6_9GAMM|nr:sigma-54 dependent transcriptional regulator [Pseudoxanthomonas winnipegensis]TAA19101.1 sigma-54-dependent Fis family transcriptional regulator [Pseudoxanthomonas winnipegensis]
MLNSNSARVLIVDDDREFAESAAEVVRYHNMSARVVGSVAEATQATRQEGFDLLLLDVMLPDGSAFDVLDNLSGMATSSIVLMTGSPSIATAARAVSSPALAYLLKPLAPDRLEQLLDQAALRLRARTQAAGDASWVSACREMDDVSDMVGQIAGTDLSALITGESGTGKELVAQAIHQRSGRRGAMVEVNCGALSEELLASQLFGHERGSFTGAHQRHIGFVERADQGTLFLDEVTEMSLGLQVYLLRMLESKRYERVGGTVVNTVDLRVVAATNRDPRQAISEGRLREDLYFRLADVTIHLPPLVARSGDAALLAQHFLVQLNRIAGTSKSLSPRSIVLILEHGWPGNVRELKSAVRRAFYLSKSELVEPLLVAVPRPSAAKEEAPGIPVGLTWAELEEKALTDALIRHGNDKTAAAKALGISVRTVHNRLARRRAHD